MPCRVIGVYREYLQPPSSIPVTEAAEYSETSVLFYQTTRRYKRNAPILTVNAAKNFRCHGNTFCSSLTHTFNIIRRESFHVTPCQHEWILSLSRGSGINFTPLSDVQKAHHSLKMNSYERKRSLYSKHDTRTI